jgi:hypothetical protein
VRPCYARQKFLNRIGDSSVQRTANTEMVVEAMLSALQPSSQSGGHHRNTRTTRIRVRRFGAQASSQKPTNEALKYA